jgi:soluble lytic murein transglycosylase-like protein
MDRMMAEARTHAGSNRDCAWGAGLAVAALVLGFADLARADVIEIGAGGSVTVISGPSLFRAEGSTLIAPQANTAAASPEPAGAPATVLSASVPDGDVARAIRAAAVRHGIDPQLLLALAWQESRFRQGAVSHKGAIGIMQLMPGTAALLGVDPRDPLQNIDGGARYLRAMLDRYGGDVRLALAAYNAGPGAVDRHGGIPPFRETRGYVATITRTLGWPPASPAAGRGG